TAARTRGGAAWILGTLKRQPEIVVPALINCLKDVRVPVRRVAVDALSQFGQQAQGAVPALLEALNDPSAAVRKSASNALWEVDPKALEEALNRTAGKRTN